MSDDAPARPGQNIHTKYKRLIKAAQGFLLGVPSRGEMSLFGSRATYPTDAAQAALGWMPSIEIEEGLIDTVEWLRQEGLAV